MSRLPMFCIASAALLAAPSPDPVERFQAAVRSGELRFRLSTPEEVGALIGKPDTTEQKPDGGMEIAFHRHGSLELMYDRFREWGEQPFVLLSAHWKGQELPPPLGPLKLRSTDDLKRLSPFTGLRGVDCSSVDLRASAKLLGRMPHDTDTRWPSPNKLPEDFAPTSRMALGRDPGMGLRALHTQGVDGHGVHIAIIDQPLLRDHEEYAQALQRLEELDVKEMPPQMHGPAVASIAVGRTCGVAPGARLTFVAVPMWKQDNRIYASALRILLDLNRQCKHPEDRIRAVSISYGGFSRQPNFEVWQAALREAEASGVLVITCDTSHRAYGTLSRRPEGSPDDPGSYRPGSYNKLGAPIAVPIGHRTLAGHENKGQYFSDPVGGMSWGAPYLVGLTALAFQANPRLTPDQAWKVMTETVRRTEAGALPNPAAMVAAAREAR